jgi:hypothetical protein
MPSFTPSTPSTHDPLAPLGALMAMTDGHQPSDRNCLSFIANSDQFLRQIAVPHVSHLTFEVDGIPFNARHVPQGNSADLIIWGTLGYLPFSVTSPQKRNNLITILEATRFLPRVKFGVDRSMRIVVTSSFKIAEPPGPTYLFEPLIQFLQESRAFIRLIGEHL